MRASFKSNFANRVAKFAIATVFVGGVSVVAPNRGSASAATGEVRTLAGSIALGSADGLGELAGFNSPSAVAVDGLGNAYVADLSNYTVRKVTPEGQVSTIAGVAGTQGDANGPVETATLSITQGIAVNGSGDVFISSGHAIRKISGGQVTTFAGDQNSGYADGLGTAARFQNPTGLAFDNSGNLFVADFGNHRIRKITTAGEVSTFAGPTSPRYPSGKRDGTAAGDGSSTLEALFSNPLALAIDSANNIYVSDSNNSAVRKIIGGQVTTIAGAAADSYGYAPGSPLASKFDGPAGIVVDADGNVFVADSANNVIRKIDTANNTTTFAGSGTAGSTNGALLSATFTMPTGLALTASGHLIITDNHQIRTTEPLACQIGFIAVGNTCVSTETTTTTEPTTTTTTTTVDPLNTTTTTVENTTTTVEPTTTTSEPTTTTIALPVCPSGFVLVENACVTAETTTTTVEPTSTTTTILASTTSTSTTTTVVLVCPSGFTGTSCEIDLNTTTVAPATTPTTTTVPPVRATAQTAAVPPVVTTPKLVFASTPTREVDGVAFATQPIVKVLDAQGNLMTTSTATVSLSIAQNGGVGGGVLTSSTSLTVTAVAGTASFAGLKIDRPGAYTITASATGFASATSGTIQIAPPGSSTAVKVTFAFSSRLETSSTDSFKTMFQGEVAKVIGIATQRISVNTVSVQSDPVFVGSTVSDEMGNWSLDVVIPDLPPGAHHLVWHGFDPDGNSVSRSIPITIAERPLNELAFENLGSLANQSQTNPSTSPETPTTPTPSPSATATPTLSSDSQSPVAQVVANASASGQPIPQAATPAASTVGELALTGSTPLALVLAGLASLVIGIFLIRRRKPART